MKILITGICGFVGSSIAKKIKQDYPEWQIFGLDNFIRSGSWLNQPILQAIDIKVYRGDIRNASDLETLPAADYVIDAAANPSVLAGVDGKTSSRQLIEHNLFGTINLLEYCKKNTAGFILLSTSRVYNIKGLAGLKMLEKDGAFYPDPKQNFPVGISADGVREEYSTEPPVSLYGSTKVTSEQLALEYGTTFNFPIWINRCGVLAGAGQFGHPAQGIFAFWIHSFRENNPLKYIGFGGTGLQVRDCLHPYDLANLLIKQLKEPITSNKEKIFNVSGGIENAMSLKQLTDYCRREIGENVVEPTSTERQFDIPWMVLDSKKAKQVWDWQPKINVEENLQEIIKFSQYEDNWCAISSL